MFKSLKIKIIISIAFFFLVVLGLETSSLAADFSVSAKNTELNIGNTTTLTIKANDCGGKFTISSSDPSIVSVGSASEWIENTTSSITLTAKKAGKATITVTAANVSDTAGDNEVTGSKPVTITVKEEKTTNTTTDSKSTDATLKSITVGEKKYNTPNTDITVPNVSSTTSSIKVEAVANSSKATVSGVGTKDLVTGTNVITLKVTAESGATKTYTIRVRRLAEETSNPNVIEEETEEPEEEVKVALKSLLIKGAISEEEKIELSYTPEFSSEVYEYQLLLDETLSDITKLDIEAIASQEDFTVEITGNEELQDGENTITITVKSKDGETSVTYKILVTKEAKVVPVSAPTVEVEQEVIEPIWNPTQKILITIFTSIITIMGIAFAVIEYRYTKENKDNIETTEVPYSGINSEEEGTKEEDKVGEIPFAKIGFEKEVEEDKVDLLKEEKKEESEFKDIKAQRDETELERKKQPKAKKGKHF